MNTLHRYLRYMEIAVVACFTYNRNRDVENSSRHVIFHLMSRLNQAYSVTNRVLSGTSPVPLPDTVPLFEVVLRL